jgi:hypothetical protein
LAREGAQREGGKGRGFSAEREDINLTATLRGWQRAGDARLWKFIVSPEHADRLDLKAHARALVSQMERDLGTRLKWVAIDHYNTDNAHVHLLVRGRDARGQALQIHPDYLKQGIRRRSQDLATQVLGYRSEREIVQSRGQTVDRLRFTDLDRALVRHGGTRGLVTIDGPTPKSTAAGRRPGGFEAEMRSLDVPASEVRHPAVWGPLGRSRPLAVHEYEFARTLTDRPVKVAVPGPYLLTRTMWIECISDRAYRSREHLAEDVVRVLREELHALLAAGVALVQLDEPVCRKSCSSAPRTLARSCAAR